MKKIVFMVFFLLISTVAFWFAGNVSEDNAKTTDNLVVKIGVTLPLSGEVAFAGAPAQKAIELALEDVKKGRKLKYDYKLIFEDDKMELKQAFLNANRFISIDKVNAVISMWLVSPALSEFMNKNKVIHMGCSWGYITAKGLYNFNHCTFHKEQTALLIQEFKKREIKKVGIIHNNTMTDEEILTYLKPELKEAGFDVEFSLAVNPSERDFRMEIAKMNKANVDIVLVFLVSPGLELFSKQAKELGYGVPFTTFDNFAYSPEYWEGQWFVADAVGSSEFQKNFLESEGLRAESCSANLYDGLKVIVEGFENAKAEEGKLPKNEDVAEYMQNLKSFDSVMGGVYVDDEGNIHAQPSLKIIRGGQIIDLH